MSPIKGLSEQKRLPRLGKIRLGVKKISEKTGKEYPVATDHFVLPDELKDIFPEPVIELPIMIPVEDDEIWCNQYYKCYSSYRGLTCKGDGVTCRRMIDKVTGEKANRDTKEVVWREGLPCEGRECPYFKSKDCKETMNLQFIMPDIPGLGVWQIDTSSINSIRNINNAAAMIRAVYKRISFIPLSLTLEETEVVNPDDGKKKRVHVLNLRTRGTMRELMAQANIPMTLLLAPPPAEDEAPLETDTTEQNMEREIEELFGAEPPEITKTEATLESGIDMVWLKEALPQAKWTEKTLRTWLVAQFKVDTTGSLEEVISRLNQEQKKSLVNQIQERLDLA